MTNAIISDLFTTSRSPHGGSSDHLTEEAEDAVLTSSHVLTLSGVLDDVDHLAPPRASSKGAGGGRDGGGGGWLAGGALDRLAPPPPRDSRPSATSGRPSGTAFRPAVADARTAGSGAAGPSQGRYADISLSDDDDDDEKRLVCLGSYTLSSRNSYDLVICCRYMTI